MYVRLQVLYEYKDIGMLVLRAINSYLLYTIPFYRVQTVHCIIYSQWFQLILERQVYDEMNE